jgi:hypothetical protein
MRAGRLVAAGLMAIAACTGTSGAGNEVEMRAASSAYRFLDLSHDFDSGWVVSLLYSGDPETNDLHAGAGYFFGEEERNSLTPIVYGVRGSLGERGVMVGIDGRVAPGVWRIVCFAGRFFDTGGEVPDYTFVDALDVSIAFGAWEAGLSADAYWIEGESFVAAGPLLKHHDSLGSWAASARFGEQDEFRVARVLDF